MILTKSGPFTASRFRRMLLTDDRSPSFLPLCARSGSGTWFDSDRGGERDAAGASDRHWISPGWSVVGPGHTLMETGTDLEGGQSLPSRDAQWSHISRQLYATSPKRPWRGRYGTSASKWIDGTAGPQSSFGERPSVWTDAPPEDRSPLSHSDRRATRLRRVKRVRQKSRGALSKHTVLIRASVTLCRGQTRLPAVANRRATVTSPLSSYHS